MGVAGDGSPAPFVSYSAFRTRRAAADVEPRKTSEISDEAEEALSQVTVRGFYDLTGFRAEADLMLWLIAPEPAALQSALRAFGGSGFGQHLDLWWTAIGVHRPAEFNKQHLPAFLENEAPREFVCVYPYTRTHDWYLLPAEERAALLSEHGRMGRDFPGVKANTISAFGLGDYEWLLAFEANELTELTDLMRHLRSAKARAYTAAELPFLTGTRSDLRKLIERRLERASHRTSSVLP
jgi:chlorite dismutase